MSIPLTSSFNPALSLLHHLVYPSLGGNFATLCLACRCRYVYIRPSRCAHGRTVTGLLVGINLRSYFFIGFSDSRFRLDGADILLLVVNNVILTSLISFRLIQAQKRLVSVLPNTAHKVYIGIMGILVESAAPAALVGITHSVTVLVREKSANAERASYILQILFSSVMVRG